MACVFQVVSAALTKPDIIVVSANFWDVARWNRYEPSVLETNETGRLAFQAQLSLWQQNFVKLMQMLQVVRRLVLYLQFVL